MPPLRAQQCTQNFHKAPKTSNGRPETTRDTHNNLSGRLVSNGSIKGRDGQPSGRNPTLLATLGICDQPGEICALPKSHHSILGLYCGFSSNGDLSTSKESGRHNENLPSSIAARDPLSLRPIEADRLNVSHNAGSITGTFVLSKSAKDKKSGAQPLPFVRGDGNIGRQCKGGVTMVGSSADNMEWQSNPITNSRPCSGNGRIPSGLGCSFRGNAYRGSMVREGAYTAHQLLGVDGRCTGSENICKAQKEYPCTITNGQQNGNLLHKPYRGNLIPEHGAASLSAMAVVSPERDNSFSRVFTRGKERDSRRRITNHAIFS